MAPKRLTCEEFKQRAILVHGDKYDYSQTEYQRMRFRTLLHHSPYHTISLSGSKPDIATFHCKTWRTIINIGL